MVLALAFGASPAAVAGRLLQRLRPVAALRAGRRPATARRATARGHGDRGRERRRRTRSSATRRTSHGAGSDARSSPRPRLDAARTSWSAAWARCSVNAVPVDRHGRRPRRRGRRRHARQFAGRRAVPARARTWPRVGDEGYVIRSVSDGQDVHGHRRQHRRRRAVRHLRLPPADPDRRSRSTDLNIHARRRSRTGI